MKLIIAGSRSLIEKDDQMFNYLNSSRMIPIEDIDEIVCGLAKGPDLIGKRWANAYKIPTVDFPADWIKYGKSAGVIRNKVMAQYADQALIFWDGKSRGSLNMADEMLKLKKFVEIISMS